jgi:hypothetical protein
MSKNRNFKIPVTWEMTGTVNVRAKSAKEALMMFHNMLDEFPEPDDAFYVDGSLDITPGLSSIMNIESFNEQIKPFAFLRKKNREVS